MAREIITDDGDRILTDSPYVSYYSPVARVVWFLLGIVNTLLAIRFLLRLFAANPGAGFVDFIYSVTAPLLNWFAGSIPTTVVGSGSVIEWSTILAMIIYWLVAWIIVRLTTMSSPAPRY